MRLAGRVAMVTGGAKGIGAAVGRAFAREGARVALLHVDALALGALTRDLERQGGQVLGLKSDVTRAGDVEAAVETIRARWGPVEVLVNNCGGFSTIRPTEEIPDDEWDTVLRVNLTSAFLCTGAVLPAVKQRRWGRIVNLSSIGGRGGLLLLCSHYAAAKAAILGFTRRVALEVAALGITVNAVAPGTVATERFKALRAADETEALAARVPMKRVAEPSEIAEGVLFLASDAAAYVTGACLDVNGGVLMT
jgi:NAD(P)-dependent dehydrogenase (short-subunit alcohol dehydrogenase family)